MSVYPVYGNRMHPSAVPSHVAARYGTSDVPHDHGVARPVRHATSPNRCGGCLNLRSDFRRPITPCTTCGKSFLCAPCAEIHANTCGLCRHIRDNPKPEAAT